MSKKTKTQITSVVQDLVSKKAKKTPKGSVLMLQAPAEGYFQVARDMIKLMTAKNFEGVYLSFDRPFPNVSRMLKQQGVDLEKILFVDAASILCKEKPLTHSRSIVLSEALDVDELVFAIHSALDQLNSSHQFILIDSLTTIAHYKSLSEIMRFSQFLMRMVSRDQQPVHLIFSVPKDLSQRKFIQDIALTTDKVICVER